MRRAVQNLSISRSFPPCTLAWSGSSPLAKLYELQFPPKDLEALCGQHVYELRTPSEPYQFIVKVAQSKSPGIFQLQHGVFAGMKLFENLFSA